MLQFREKEVLAYGERQAFLISSGIGHLFACCGFDGTGSTSVILMHKRLANTLSRDSQGRHSRDRPEGRKE